MSKTRLTRRSRTGEVMTLVVGAEVIEIEIGRIQEGSVALTIVSSPEVKILKNPETKND